VLKDTPRLMLKVTPEINGVSLMYNF